MIIAGEIIMLIGGLFLMFGIIGLIISTVSGGGSEMEKTFNLKTAWDKLMVKILVAGGLTSTLGSILYLMAKDMQ